MSEFRRKLMMACAANKRSNDIIYPGLIAAWSAKGKSNDDADRAVLRDLTGNGHDITLNGFAFSEMSGYGGYGTQDVDMWYKYTQFHSYEKINANELKITLNNNNVSFITQVKINGDRCILQFSEPNIVSKIAYTEFTQIDDYTYNVVVTDNIKHTISFTKEALGKTITIKSLPLYPDALVFDGVDDYGIVTDLPRFDDFTVIFVRDYLTKNIGKFQMLGLLQKQNGTAKTDKVFAFESCAGNDGFYILSYGNQIEITSIMNFDKDVVWANTNSYNGLMSINKGNNKIFDINQFLLGKSQDNLRFFHGMFYSAYLFDRSLDEQEIKAFVRKYIDPEYLLPSEIPNPDCYYDFSLGSNDDENRETIVDQSGNGNDAVAHNFAWSGMSGYEGYSTDFNTWGSAHTNGIIIKNYNKVIINKIGQELKNSIFYKRDFTSSFVMKLKISGVTTDKKLIWTNKVTGESITIDKDGLYSISVSEGSGVVQGFYCKGFDALEECNITIELLPEYEGALVFDGIDDYISLDAFDSGFKTVFILITTDSTSGIFYDQRKDGYIYSDVARFVLLTTFNGIAYNWGNAGGVTYINGKLNTKIEVASLKTKKHLVCVVNSTADDIYTTPVINQVAYSGNISSAKNKLYKFLGFKEALTEEQIQYVIKKYNLLDGVDEIEVS